MTKKALRLLVFGLMIAALIVGAAATSSKAADHLEAPLVRQDGRIDINDIYVYHPETPGGGQDLDRTVLVLTVNPAAGVMSGTDFSRKARYEFLIDTDGDAEEDITIEAKFSRVRGNGRQRVKVELEGEDNNGDEVEVKAKGWTEDIFESRDGSLRVFAGLRDDPFFFDAASFGDGPTFCETGDVNFFAGFDTSALVIEVPTSLIGSQPVGVWGRIRVDGYQVERMGRPAILTVFIPPNPFEAGDPNLGNLEDQFNATEPEDDQALWRGEIVNTLTLLYSLNDGAGDDPSDDAATIQAIADILLPDILTVDLAQPTGFLNGRGLADDVIDAELGLVTEGLITTDCIDNDSTFLADFPYLGLPNN
jgi:hypothetical protein